MTRPGNLKRLVQALACARRFTTGIVYENPDAAIAFMTRCNAFEEHENEHDLRLRLPAVLDPLIST